MIEKIEQSIKKLAGLVDSKKELSADEALKFTQAVCNLANARACISNTDINKQ